MTFVPGLDLPVVEPTRFGNYLAYLWLVWALWLAYFMRRDCGRG